MIRLQNASKSFPGSARDTNVVVAVEDLTLTVQDGELHCLLGTSGCGKTTTLRMINRLVKPTHGRILVGDDDVSKVDVIALRRRIGYVIQTGGLFPHMTVEKNIGLLCLLEGWSRDRARGRVRTLLELVGLPPEEFAGRYPNELSGGQRQRVGVARALALDPDYVLMDEPFGALDPITRTQIHEEFVRLRERVKKTIIMVTHDLDEALKLGDRISLMDRGRLIQTGTAADLQNRPADQFVSDFLESHAAGASS